MPRIALFWHAYCIGSVQFVITGKPSAWLYLFWFVPVRLVYSVTLPWFFR